MESRTSVPVRTIPVVAINVISLVIVAGWLVVASYALAYLVSH